MVIKAIEESKMQIKVTKLLVKKESQISPFVNVILHL